MFAKAYQYYNAGAVADAERACLEALETDPNDTDSLHLLGLVSYQTGRAESGIGLVQKAIRIRKDVPLYHNNLALMLHEQRDLKGAEGSYRQLLALQPDAVDALANLGNILVEMDRIDEAVKHYEGALALKPDYAEVFVALGNALSKQEKPDEAELAYKKAIGLKPVLAEAHNNLGTLLYGRGRFGEAIASYKEAARLDPANAIICNNMGSVYRELNDFGNARDCYGQALALQPEYAAAHSNVANLFFNQGKTEEAVAHYERALAINPRYAEAHIGMGDIFKSRGKVDEAILSYRRSIEIRPEFAKAHNNLGNAFKEKGALAEAIDCYRQAIALDPEYRASLFNLGSVLAEQGKPESAAPYLQRCLALDPADSYGAQFLLARMGLGAAPQRASDTHMQRLYAQRAAFWDRGIHSASHYRAHELVVNLLRRLSKKADMDILDAGCGTGLVGILLRGQSKTLAGVDLSPAMLEKAREKGIYDRLYTGDLVAFMEKSPDAYDAITCAATLIHFGDLNAVFGAIKKILRKDGLFVATLFPNEDENGVSVASFDGLAQGGCYAHGRHYIYATAQAHGLTVEALDTEVHEHIKDVPMNAFVMALRK